MSRQTFPALVDAHIDDVSTVLTAAGVAAPFSVGYEQGALWVEAADDDDALVVTTLEAFVPLRSRDEPLPLPEELRSHAIHIRDFGRLDLAGIAALTEAQRWHVLRDVCRAMALLVDRRLD